MTRADRESLRARLGWLRPSMHVELPLAVVLDLLAPCAALELERDELLLETLEEDA